MRYVIRETSHYYGPHHDVDYARDESGGVIVFDGHRAAREWMAEAVPSGGLYELRHGEYASPTYRPVPLHRAPRHIQEQA